MDRSAPAAGVVERTVSAQPRIATAVGTAPRQIRMRRIRCLKARRIALKISRGPTEGPAARGAEHPGQPLRPMDRGKPAGRRDQGQGHDDGRREPGETRSRASRPTRPEAERQRRQREAEGGDPSDARAGGQVEGQHHDPAVGGRDRQLDGSFTPAVVGCEPDPPVVPAGREPHRHARVARAAPQAR